MSLSRLYIDFQVLLQMLDVLNAHLFELADKYPGPCPELGQFCLALQRARNVVVGMLEERRQHLEFAIAERRRWFDVVQKHLEESTSDHDIPMDVDSE